MQTLLNRHYGLTMLSAEHASAGAGSDTWFVTCREGRYVVKYPAQSEINHPDAEPGLCEKLLARGIPVCRFLRNRQGTFLTMDAQGRCFHVQDFIEGRTYGLNEAPEWLMEASAGMLGRIHAALRDEQGLPEGIGAGFFRYMTPERALASYRHSLALAQAQGDAASADDLRWRMGLMERLQPFVFDPDSLTLCATHGDYFISQIICGGEEIRAVIDWTTACVHPVVWEILRSFVYAAPSCREGCIDAGGLVRYVSAYLQHAPLSENDLHSMVPLFFRQLAVCDYYGQYYASSAANRHIYLHQARFSTKLLMHLEQHGEALTAALLAAPNT